MRWTTVLLILGSANFISAGEYASAYWARCLRGPEVQNAVYVNGETGNDAWDGRCEVWDGGTCGPKATIQAGIDAAWPGEEVLIADSVYTGAGNRDLDFGGKAITVRSAAGDPSACIIDCEQQGRGFYFHSGETAPSVVQDLTIRNGTASEYGGGVPPDRARR